MQHSEIVDTINAILYWKDSNGYYLNCNKYFLNYLGVKSKKEIIGKTDYDLYSKLDADKIKKNDVLVMANGGFYGEEYITVQGEAKIFITSKNRLLDVNGDTIGISGNSVDITELKKKTESEKQQAIRDEEYKIMQVIDLVNASIYWKDKDGRYLGCNKYVLDMAGVNSRDEIIGKTDFELLWHDDAPRIRKIDESVIKTGSYNGREYTSVANNREKFLLTSKNRLLTHDGRIIGIVGVSLDNSAEEAAEQLKIENIRLEAENKINQVILEKNVVSAETERLRLENELQKIENEAYVAKEKSQERITKFINKMLHDIQSFRIEELNVGTGLKSQITNADLQIKLTKRELEVLYYISLNKSPKEIAQIITILENKAVSDSTINAIINKKLYPKFAVFNIGQLVEKAIMLNFDPVPNRKL